MWYLNVHPHSLKIFSIHEYVLDNALGQSAGQISHCIGYPAAVAANVNHNGHQQSDVCSNVQIRVWEGWEKVSVKVICCPGLDPQQPPKR